MQVIFFDLQTRKPLRRVTYPMSGSFVSCAFSNDNKFFCAQSDGSDAHLCYWEWEKEVLLHSHITAAKITRISFSPKSVNIVGTSGPSHMKIWNLTYGSDKLTPILPAKKEQENFTDHAWLKDGKLILITDQVNAFESSALPLSPSLPLTYSLSLTHTHSRTFSLTHTPSLPLPPSSFTLLSTPPLLSCTSQGALSIFEEVEGVLEVKQTLPPPGPGGRYNTIAVYQKGFVTGGTATYFRIFEKTVSIAFPPDLPPLSLSPYSLPLSPPPPLTLLLVIH